MLAIYRVALPQVNGYLLLRCGSAALADALTTETFLDAVNASRQGSLTEVNTAWLVGVARHKLVDYWRRHEREQRSLAAAEAWVADVDDPWDEWLDTEAAYTALAHLPIPRRGCRGELLFDAPRVRRSDQLRVNVDIQHGRPLRHIRRRPVQQDHALPTSHDAGAA